MYNNPFQIAFGIGVVILLIGLFLDSRVIILAGIGLEIFVGLSFLIRICVLWRGERRNGSTLIERQSNEE